MRHLTRMEDWFYKQPNGTLRLKRVSAQAEERFPKPLRRVLADKGPAAAVKAIKETRGLSLSDAWAQLKEMVNHGARGQ
jgi:hypothetical protein